ncbi:ATP-dependent RNA helicase RhlE [Aquicella siphonis]|uniref:ATP-dependent RNA helicase RhlE n=1 Tax=Aquicella siphonis TaxID=254247 RepID=A0A5E4PK16_9COXI|nr:DEAD/DEAH box helicase [Aquicella siphonis]VVC76838.1 ATP-dependent RNA helicase RhlE [Aquicella siphonis]
MNSFSDFNFNSDIYKAISICGYTRPTPVQSQSIPFVMKGKDVVVSAQTGTGKTASFVLPALQRLSQQGPSKKTRVLILTPTRELASQITKAASLYGKFMRFNIVSLVGGMPYHHQIKDLARGADILVATPGRLLDHLEQKRVDLSQVEMLVLDEADRMLDMGFIDDVQYIAKLTPAKRQTLLFSATLDNKLMNAVKHLLKNPERIDLSHEKLAAPQIRQEMYKANNPQHKNRLLKHFLNDANIFKAIIFSATKINADKLANQLRDEGFAAAALHGDLRQNVRNRTLEQLRRGKIQFLVATDVAARGIDVSDITHVFNYDLPRFCEDYVHRIGRTGRAGKTGVAISFVLPSDARHLQSIERYLGQRIKLMQNIDAGDSSAPKKHSVNSHEILTLPHNKVRAEKHMAPAKQHRQDRNFQARQDDGQNEGYHSGHKHKPGVTYKTSKKDKQSKSHKTARPFASKNEKNRSKAGGSKKDPYEQYEPRKGYSHKKPYSPGKKDAHDADTRKPLNSEMPHSRKNREGKNDTSSRFKKKPHGKSRRTSNYSAAGNNQKRS